MTIRDGIVKGLDAKWWYLRIALIPKPTTSRETLASDKTGERASPILVPTTELKWMDPVVDYYTHILAFALALQLFYIESCSKWDCPCSRITECFRRVLDSRI